MRWVYRVSCVSYGRLINIYIWRHPMFAASTARISLDAKKVMASAGSGKSCFLLRLRQLTVLSTDGTIGSVTVHWLRLYGISSPSSKSAPAPYGTHPRSGVLPVSVSQKRYRSTRPADRRREGRPDPVGCIPSSESSFRLLLRLLFPDPLQDLPELIGARGWSD